MNKKLQINEINVKKLKNSIFIKYTFLFCVIILSVFLIFIKNNKGFIWYSDGAKQHYMILYHFNQIIRNLLKNGFPFVSWNMGLGLDTIGQYSYYVLGDPFAYLSLLVPIKNLEKMYSILVILRMYCVGLAFIFYCRYQKKKNINTLIGAIIYTFGGFVLYAGVRHPYFTNALILLPLNFLGMEKLLKENRKAFFIFIIGISAINSYYFFYMITVVTAIYGIVRYFVAYKKDLKDFWKKLKNVILSYVIGVSIAGIILLPTIYTFFNSARPGCENPCEYITNFYSYFCIGIISMRFKNWTAISLAAITILMLPILLTKYKEKEARTYLILFVITTIMLMCPFVASMMNGFSFPSNRWVFAYSFILSYIVTICFDGRLEYSKKQKILMFATLILYLIASVVATKFKIRKNIDFYAIFTISLVTFLIISFYNKNKKQVKRAKILILILIIINIFVLSLTLYSSWGRDYVKEFIDCKSIDKVYGNLNGKIDNYKELIEYIKENDDSFFRIGKVENSHQNISLVYDYHPIETYLSVGNGYVYNFSSELEDRAYTSTRCINGADRRTRVTTLIRNEILCM